MLKPPLGLPVIATSLIQHPRYQTDTAVKWFKQDIQQSSQTLFAKGL